MLETQEQETLIIIKKLAEKQVQLLEILVKVVNSNTQMLETFMKSAYLDGDDE